MPTRKANARWEGGLKGSGEIGSGTGVVSGRYTIGSRFEEATGTNPEELLAAAQAACFSMKFGIDLENAGGTPEYVQTDAACTVEKVGGGWSITRIHLTTRARVANIDESEFRRVAESSKNECPVARAFKGNVEITVDATLE
jgi:lipoyl-dependent peroxiredoxin